MLDSYTFMISIIISYFFFFFNDTATTEIYTLSLHDALPIYSARHARPAENCRATGGHARSGWPQDGTARDRKSTRLNSSHSQISYAVFCLKKKKKSTSEYQLTNTLRHYTCMSISHAQH